VTGAIGCLIGILCGIIGSIQIFLVGVGLKFFRFFGKLFRGVPFKEVLITTFGGLCLGLLAQLVPLSLLSGNGQVRHAILMVENEAYTYDFLILSAVGKMLAVAISIGSGFEGGCIFPSIFVGVYTGLSAYLLVGNNSEFPLLLALSCFMVGVPSSIYPIPLTMLTIVAFTLQLSSYQSGPMVVSAITSHCIASGTGLLIRLMKLAKRDHLFDDPVVDR